MSWSQTEVPTKLLFATPLTTKQSGKRTTILIEIPHGGIVTNYIINQAYNLTSP